MLKVNRLNVDCKVIALTMLIDPQQSREKITLLELVVLAVFIH